MKTQVIMNDKEWQRYKKSFCVGSQQHRLSDPPSFPTIVISEIVTGGYGDCGEPVPVGLEHSRAMIVEHSFIEVHEMKRFLGLA